jgi:hypothetical protein
MAAAKSSIEELSTKVVSTPRRASVVLNSE